MSKRILFPVTLGCVILALILGWLEGLDDLPGSIRRAELVDDGSRLDFSDSSSASRALPTEKSERDRAESLVTATDAGGLLSASGHVMSTSGRPVSGAEIFAEEPSRSLQRVATSTDSGRYVTAELSQRVQRLICRHPLYFEQAQAAHLSGGLVARPFDWQLRRKAVEVRLVDPHGFPIELRDSKSRNVLCRRIAIDVSDSGEDEGARRSLSRFVSRQNYILESNAPTDLKAELARLPDRLASKGIIGHLVLENPTEELLVRILASDQLLDESFVRADSDLVDLTVDLARLQNLMGGFRVSLLNPRGEPVEAEVDVRCMRRDHVPYSISSIAPGVYEVAGLPSGPTQYLVSSDGVGIRTGVVVIESGKIVEAGSIVLHASATLRGDIASFSAALVGAQVVLRECDDAGVLLWHRVALVDEGGAFEFSGLSPGLYSVMLDGGRSSSAYCSLPTLIEIREGLEHRMVIAVELGAVVDLDWSAIISPGVVSIEMVEGACSKRLDYSTGHIGRWILEEPRGMFRFLRTSESHRARLVLPASHYSVLVNVGTGESRRRDLDTSSGKQLEVLLH